MPRGYQRWRLWAKGAPLLDFLKCPLQSFFLAQSLVEVGQPRPFGQWAHGAKGVFQFYRELLKTADLRLMITFLEYITAKKPKGVEAQSTAKSVDVVACQSLDGALP
jgi:hypothetical protein